ncbi:hypothetical protein [Burkholderia sp. Ac-20379]|uniref:hypothetical protein n=1 Tax=Burkholderia sp. Ac-20379 TaxID=2703900 RepID=UPI00197FA0A5|nr:hypothetical protein [Burkholderia sp. Ac-20379]MBN3726772.1 hypothetical protein [Burkholderia sp. Ac-20379]
MNRTSALSDAAIDAHRVIGMVQCKSATFALFKVFIETSFVLSQTFSENALLRLPRFVRQLCDQVMPAPSRRSLGVERALPESRLPRRMPSDSAIYRFPGSQGALKTIPRHACCCITPACGADSNRSFLQRNDL